VLAPQTTVVIHTARRVSLSWLREVLGEEVHEEGVVPVAVGSPFVLAHSADRLEADLGVAADRCGVVGGGVDADAMVIAHTEQVIGEGADGVGSDALPVHIGAQVDIHRGVPVVGFGFFGPLNAADNLTVEQDDKQVEICRVDVVDELSGEIVAAPALSHFGHRADRHYCVHVGQHRTTKRDPVSLQAFVVHDGDVSDHSNRPGQHPKRNYST
jgi:hypothetical protein